MYDMVHSIRCGVQNTYTVASDVMSLGRKHDDCLAFVSSSENICERLVHAIDPLVYVFLPLELALDSLSRHRRIEF